MSTKPRRSSAGAPVEPEPGERMGDALWPWAERLQPAIAWLRAAGYLVEGSGSVCQARRGTVRPRGVQGLFRQ